MQNSFSYEWFRTKTGFNTEAKVSSEMVACEYTKVSLLVLERLWNKSSNSFSS